jgi:hypothetical protein
MSRATSNYLPDGRAWATEVLDLDEPTADTARQALLRRLPEEDFVPPQSWLQALKLLQQPEPVPLSATAPHDERFRYEEIRGWEEVEAFADEFFRLDPAQRQRRWHRLASRYSFSVLLSARLEALKPGLDVAAVERSDPLARKLADKVRELFVLRPAERAMRRQEFLETVGHAQQKAEALADLVPGLPDVERAAQQLKREHPQLAALEPRLIDRLANWSKQQARVSRGQRRAAPPVTLHTPQPQTQSSGNRSGGWPVWLLFVLVMIGCIRLVTVSVSSRFSSPSTSPSPELRQELKRMEAEIRAGKGGEATRRLFGLDPPPPPPPGFDPLDPKRVHPGDNPELKWAIERLQEREERRRQQERLGQPVVPGPPVPGGQPQLPGGVVPPPVGQPKAPAGAVRPPGVPPPPPPGSNPQPGRPPNARP